MLSIPTDNLTFAHPGRHLVRALQDLLFHHLFIVVIKGQATSQEGVEYYAQ